MLLGIRALAIKAKEFDINLIAGSVGTLRLALNRSWRCMVSKF